MTNLSIYRGNQISSDELFGDTFAPYVFEVDDDNPERVTMIWREALEWHVEALGLEQLTFTDEGADLERPVPYAVSLTRAELVRLTGDVYLEVTESDSDELELEISVELVVHAGTAEALGEAAWPFVATLTNVFDPGTFGAEYVMGNVAAALETRTSCQHCDRTIFELDGAWVDPEASGDDRVWAETCDQHDTFIAEHEPV